MRKIINALLFGGILYLGDMLFPEYINVLGIKSLIIAVLLYYAADWFYGLVVGAISVIGAALGAGGAILVSIPIIISAVLYIPLKLWLLSTYVPGISINGILTYVLLTVAISIFSVEIKREA